MITTHAQPIGQISVTHLVLYIILLESRRDSCKNCYICGWGCKCDFTNVIQNNTQQGHRALRFNLSFFQTGLIFLWKAATPKTNKSINQYRFSLLSTKPGTTLGISSSVQRKPCCSTGGRKRGNRCSGILNGDKCVWEQCSQLSSTTDLRTRPSNNQLLHNARYPPDKQWVWPQEFWERGSGPLLQPDGPPCCQPPETAWCHLTNFWSFQKHQVWGTWKHVL